MIKLENAGLRAPRKITLGAGLHSQKGVRAPVSKMIGALGSTAEISGLQGSRDPPPPPLWDPARSKQLSTVANVGFQFGLYHVAAPLSFLRSISLASLFVNNK